MRQASMCCRSEGGKIMKKINNQGFSLIEILVSLAIAGVMMVGVYTIMNSSANSYRSTNKDINVQMEAETTSNFMYEMLLEATEVEVLDKSVAGNDCKVVVIKNNVYNEDSAGNKVANPMYNFIVYNNNDKKMYYTKADGNGVTYSDDFVNSSVSGVIDDTKLLAENVDEFTMKPSKLKANTPMTFSVTIKDGNKSFTAGNSVSTRNHIATEAPATVAPGP